MSDAFRSLMRLNFDPDSGWLSSALVQSNFKSCDHLDTESYCIPGRAWHAVVDGARSDAPADISDFVRRLMGVCRCGLRSHPSAMKKHHCGIGLTGKEAVRCALNVAIHHIFTDLWYHFPRPLKTCVFPCPRPKPIHTYQCVPAWSDCQIISLDFEFSQSSLLDMQILATAACGATARLDGTAFSQHKYDHSDEVRRLTNVLFASLAHVLGLSFPGSREPGRLPWRAGYHAFASPATRRTVLTLTVIRSLRHETVVSLLPNELLFLIFELL